MKKFLGQLAIILIATLSSYSQGEVRTQYEFSLLHGETLTIQAIPNTGFQFTNWTRMDGSQYHGLNPLVLAGISDDIELNANFSRINVQIQIQNLTGGGNPTGAGVYQFGDPVTMESNPWVGWRLVHWFHVEGDSILSEDPIWTFIATDNMIIQPVYELRTYIIHINVNPTNAGSINEVIVKVYPNPTSKTLVVEGNDMQSITIWSQLGAKVASFDVSGDKVELDISNLQPSSYILRARGISGKEDATIFIVE